MGKIYCVIPAAGLSSRMGKFKPLLPIDGKPAIVYLVETMFRSGVDGCIIVTGHNGDRIQKACAGLPNILWASNPDYQTTGMFESAQIGFSLLPKDCSRVLLIPADIPRVSYETVKDLLRIDNPLVFPSFQLKKGHPVSIAPQLLPTLCAYDGPDGLRGAFRTLDVTPSYLNTADPYILMDMDTPEDYEKLISER